GLASPPKAYPKVIAPWDSNISQLEVEDSLEIINFFMKQMNRDEKIKSVSGGFGYGDSRISVKNSNGINISEKSTSVSISAEIIMEESINGKKENSNGYDWQSYNDFGSIEPEKIFDTAYNMAIKGLKKTKIETMSCPVILSPLAVDLLVSSAISSGICADAVYEKRSFLQNKLDTPISNEILEIVDDPWVENGYATSSFDIEGVPTKPLKIVENGYLKSFLHNVYTANLFKTQSTGHASRSWQSATIGIDTSNIIVKNGNTKLDSMISEIDNGIFIEYSYDSPNIVTGDFSGLITNGYIIKDGEIGNSLKETMLGTNLLDLYQKIEKVSVETIRKDSEYLPYILVSELTVSGAK
ncbi:MAG: TldD/PmbA family protein, partial [archaeon]|nr:TldD/PmbA family protein [archaeon]